MAEVQPSERVRKLWDEQCKNRPKTLDSPEARAKANEQAFEAYWRVLQDTANPAADGKQRG